jgi:CheY-like chemotaxis protein
MKKRLIHNNNTSFNRKDLFPLTEQLVFDLPLEVTDVDKYINDLLRGDFGKDLMTADIVFIKVALSENYLEYLGIRLAYHIRLTKHLDAKANIPIVFIAEEDIQFIGITCADPSILFTSGIYRISENFDSLKKILQEMTQGVIKPLTDKQRFIDSVVINPPANYSSHHSIANEWSLLRWSKVLDLSEENSPLKATKENIDNLLYYKYLLTKYPVEGEPDKAKYHIDSKGKILYIDDEWQKGWDIVLKAFFKLSPAIKFSSLETSFKEKTEAEILELCKAETEKIEPDLIILDLRLSDTDFEMGKKPREMTGCKVLQAIKKINPCIKVIIFTASNKVWNLLELQKEGADGFILKESPEYGTDRKTTRTTIKEFADTVKDLLQYTFLKRFYSMCMLAAGELVKKDTDEANEYRRFINELKKQLEIIRSSLLLIDLNKPSTIDIAFLGCYNLMEQVKNYYLRYDKKDYAFYLGLDLEILKRYSVTSNKLSAGEMFVPNDRNDRPSWFTVQAALFLDYFRISSPSSYQDVLNLKSIADKRNEFVHDKKTGFSIEDLGMIIDLLYKACGGIKE